MKTITTILLLVLFTSCSDYYNVRTVSTRQVIQCWDKDNRNFRTGDTVCVYMVTNTEGRVYWRIANNGTRKDSSYTVLTISGKDTTRETRIVSYIGIIQEGKEKL